MDLQPATLTDQAYLLMSDSDGPTGSAFDGESGQKPTIAFGLATETYSPALEAKLH